MKNLQRQKGFTLVELAIVLTIIGLLIGGILKGQQLIANARVTAQMAQVQGIDAATTTFRDAYGALPGDLSTATTRVANCTGPCTNGNGDGLITAAGAAASAVSPSGGAAQTLPGTGTELDGYWAMLADANLISGSNAGTGWTATFGVLYPNAKINGGLQVATYTDGYIYISNTTTISAEAGPGTGTMTPAQAAQIDRKMDDGDAVTGSVMAGGTFGAAATPAAGPCATAAGVYNETDTTKDCGQFYRIQQ
jgi:prepilin-type N-terminal cleavage/methylation domain-containing protein